jgi:hypothetical protein
MILQQVLATPLTHKGTPRSQYLRVEWRRAQMARHPYQGPNGPLSPRAQQMRVEGRRVQMARHPHQGPNGPLCPQSPINEGGREARPNGASSTTQAQMAPSAPRAQQMRVEGRRAQMARHPHQGPNGPLCPQSPINEGGRETRPNGASSTTQAQMATLPSEPMLLITKEHSL